MIDRLFFVWVGDDDSGPEDVKDDMDLECEKAEMIINKFVFAFEEPTYLE